jgi:hypothetical protein
VHDDLQKDLIDGMANKATSFIFISGDFCVLIWVLLDQLFVYDVITINYYGDNVLDLFMMCLILFVTYMLKKHVCGALF